MSRPHRPQRIDAFFGDGVAAALAQRFEIGARAERPAAPGKDRDACRVIGIEAGKGAD